GPEYPGGPNYPSGTAALVLAQYPPGADPQATFDLVGTHPGACRNRHIDHLWSQWVPVYEYEFNYQHAPYYFPPMSGFAPLAAHTIDIQFLFPGWHGGILGMNHAPPNAWTTGEISGSEIHSPTNSSQPGPTSRPPAIRTGLGTRLGRDMSTKKACLNTYRRTFPVCRHLPMRSS